MSLIFNIQRCSIHDGDGLRTLVFFKGCPLRCKWCANPESQLYGMEVMESRGKCIGCGACIELCPEHAIVSEKNGMSIDREKCIDCFRCADRCYAAAKYIVGKEYEPEELLKEIEKDKHFYEIKGGGVTFSGGEPLTQGKYLEQIARLCQNSGINVAIESCGIGEWDSFKDALPYIDSMFLDIKHIDSEKHKELTGAGNEQILNNIRKIAETGVKITIRTPVVPGLTDSYENILGIAQFILELPGIQEYELLAYHELGVNKYIALGREYELKEITPPTDEVILERVKKVNQMFRNTGQICFFTKDNKKIIEI